MPRINYQLGLSEDALHSLQTLASNLREARKARGWSIEEAAKRCLLSVNAYRKAESANPGTAIGVYLSIMDVMGLVDGLADVAAPHRDETGRRLKRIGSVAKRKSP